MDCKRKKKYKPMSHISTLKDVPVGPAEVQWRLMSMALGAHFVKLLLCIWPIVDKELRQLINSLTSDHEAHLSDHGLQACFFLLILCPYLTTHFSHPQSLGKCYSLQPGMRFVSHVTAS